MEGVAAALTSAAIPGLRAAVGDDHGKSPTVDIELVEGEWKGPDGRELMRLMRDEPRDGHPRVYVGGDIRTTETKMTVVAMMMQPGEDAEVARVLCEVLGGYGGASKL